MSPLRKSASETSEMVSQVLFGETFVILEEEKEWSKISLSFDSCKGFIDNKQYLKITENYFLKLKEYKQYVSGEVIDFISNNKNELTMVPLGSNLPFYNNDELLINTQKHKYEGVVLSEKKSKNEITQIAYNYLNTPYLWGGKTPFGIDASGFVQMVYKLCGYTLLRNANEQATQGEVLSFIEESEPGDLAFFDNEEGEIIHVGIILKDYHIIHSFGKVRIDTLDHSGIFNADIQKHTHKLRIIKKMI
jgi:hypothetical protein